MHNLREKIKHEFEKRIYKNYGLLRYDAEHFGKQLPILRKDVLPPSSDLT
jgi:hypothetical protein